MGRVMGNEQVGTWFLFGVMKMFQEWIVVMVVDSCDYTKTH